jgi:solute carrier family 45 protein 1/2/4
LVVGFWVLDLSNNTVQGPCRALLVDVAPLSQQNLGGSLFSFMLGKENISNSFLGFSFSKSSRFSLEGLGNLSGFYAGSLHLVKWLPFLGTDLRALFLIAIAVLAITILLTVIFTNETPFVPTKEGKVQRNSM